MEDSEIIALYWKREERAILETQNKYESYCYSISYRILKNKEDAKECVNDTYWNAWNSIPPKKPNCLSVFLGKITRNLSIDTYRKQHAKKRGAGEIEYIISELEDSVISDNAIDKELEQRFLVDCINRYLAQLPTIKRNIFVGRYWYFYSIKEMSQGYNISENKIRMMLYRMRKELKLHLEKEGVFI